MLYSKLRRNTKDAIKDHARQYEASRGQSKPRRAYEGSGVREGRHEKTQRYQGYSCITVCKCAAKASSHSVDRKSHRGMLRGPYCYA